MNHENRPDLQMLALLFLLSKQSPMTLENRTWFVELGTTILDPNDFTPRATLLINGVKVDMVNMMQLQNYLICA